MASIRLTFLLCCVPPSLAMAPLPVFAGDCFEYRDRLHWTGGLETYCAGDVGIVGNHAYVADSDLQVFDITDPAAPRSLAWLSGVGANALAVAGSHLYVVTRHDFRILDTADPIAPSLVGAVDVEEGLGVALSGNRAVIAAGLSGVHVIDVTDIEAPVLLGSVDTPDCALQVAVAEPYVYAADRASGLQVIDISDPVHPVIVGSRDTPGTAMDVATADGYVYLADFESAVSVIDVRDPSRPVIVAGLSELRRTRTVTVSGPTLYTGDDGGVEAVDISDPRKPEIVGTAPATDRVLGISLLGPHAYVASGTSSREDPPTFHVLDIGNPQGPRAIGGMDTPGLAADVVVAGDVAFTTDWGFGLRAIDVSDPGNPHELGHVDTPWKNAYGAALAGGHVLVADGPGLQVIDIADPRGPRIVGSVDMDDAQKVAVAGDLAFVADGGRGLRVVDITSPGNPRLVGEASLAGGAFDVAVAGRYVFVAAGEAGLQVFDIGLPEEPQWVGGVGGLVFDVSLAGDLVSAVGLRTLRVIDVSEPRSPRIAGTLWLPVNHINDIAASGSQAYVTAGNHVLIVDLSDPGNPRVTGGATMPWESEGIAVAEDRVYVAAEEAGLWILPAACASVTPVRLLSFTGSVDAGGILLAWEAASALDLHGFHVHRRTNGTPWERITERLLVGGPAFSHLDRSAKPGVLYRYELEAVSRNGETERFGPVEIALPIGNGPTLRAAPNPASGSTRIDFDLPGDGRAVLRVFDLSGRVRRTFQATVNAPGPYEIEWDLRDADGYPVPAGIYLVQLVAQGMARSGRIIVAR